MITLAAVQFSCLLVSYFIGGVQKKETRGFLIGLAGCVVVNASFQEQSGGVMSEMLQNSAAWGLVSVLALHLVGFVLNWLKFLS